MKKFSCITSILVLCFTLVIITTATAADYIYTGGQICLPYCTTETTNSRISGQIVNRGSAPIEVSYDLYDAGGNLLETISKGTIPAHGVGLFIPSVEFPQYMGAIVTIVWSGNVEYTPYVVAVLDKLDGEGNIISTAGGMYYDASVK